MELKQVDIVGHREFARQAKQLYYSAFPKYERIPWWLLVANSWRKGINLTAWMQGDTFCGMTASVTVGQLHFLLFFAIAESLRGQGYGSTVLAQLQRQYDQVVLNVETLDKSADNYAQRKRRFAFYEKNGFYDTGWHVWEVGGKFRVLGTNPQLNVSDYKKLFRKLTFGVWNVKLRKERNC